MPVKFLKITEDPYTNNSNLFVLILTQARYSTPDPSAPGNSYIVNGQLKDPNGNIVGYMWIATIQDYEVTGSLSDEAFAHSFLHDQHTMLVPPGYSFALFDTAIALQGTLEELSPFIRGM